MDEWIEITETDRPPRHVVVNLYLSEVDATITGWYDPNCDDYCCLDDQKTLCGSVTHYNLFISKPKPKSTN